MMRRSLSAILALAVVGACARKSPEPLAEPEVVNARMADNLEAPIARGDCKEAVRRALARPNLDVEKVPAPLAMTPPPIDTKRMPKGVADKNGYYQVRFEVLVDTLGKADMKTFAVVESSHAWLGTSVKTAVAKWKFAPAEVAGCKVPRNYTLGISPRGKTPAAPAPAKPGATKPGTTKKPPV
jgi:hypothetical protein